MHFTREQRKAWAADTRDSPFNRWLHRRTSGANGLIDLELLTQVAAEFGVDATRYDQLNPGQRRMNIGNRLRKIVPPHLYAPDAASAAIVRKEPTRQPPLKPASVFGLPPEWRFIEQAPILELLGLQAAILDQLQVRGIVRTGNAPLGDYAECLFARALGWSLSANSEKSFDARDEAGLKYQIKARRLRGQKASERQLSVIRNLPDATFDKLAAVLFDANFQVMRAALIPHAVVLSRSTFVRSVNGWRFILDDEIWKRGGVEDVTSLLQSVALDGDTSLCKVTG